MREQSNLHTAWATLLVRSLICAGVKQAIISPGSRSTPLALAMLKAPGLVCRSVLDERAAGFFALGQARVTKKPSVLLCTSGTACAHYFPSLIEASITFIPIIVLTADRPWDSYHSGTSQTIDQVKMFGDFIRHYREVGVPDPAPSALRALPRIASQAVHYSMFPTPGPVHINAQFRKPLEPIDTQKTEDWEPEFQKLLQKKTNVFHPEISVAKEAILCLAKEIAQTEKGLIVCGPAAKEIAELKPWIDLLAEKTKFPVLPEATSQIRFGPETENTNYKNVCYHFDAFLRSSSFRKKHSPQLLLEFGSSPVSKGYAEYLSQYPDCARYVIAPYGWNDPFGTADAMIFGDPATVSKQLVEALQIERTHESQWQNAFINADKLANKALSQELQETKLTEGNISYHLIKTLPENAALFIGNSNPVRDLNTYTVNPLRSLHVLHQRGASGIDGFIAGAFGAGSVLETPLVVLLGDLSFLHDLGSLLLAKQAKRPLVFLVVQNNGGRIFEQLPIFDRKELDDLFTKYFVTPSSISFDNISEPFDISYARVNTTQKLIHSLKTALVKPECTLIEAIVSPLEGTVRRKQLWQTLEKTFSSMDSL